MPVSEATCAFGHSKVLPEVMRDEHESRLGLLLIILPVQGGCSESLQAGRAESAREGRDRQAVRPGLPEDMPPGDYRQLATATTAAARNAAALFHVPYQPLRLGSAFCTPQ